MIIRIIPLNLTFLVTAYFSVATSFAVADSPEDFISSQIDFVKGLPKLRYDPLTQNIFDTLNKDLLASSDERLITSVNSHPNQTSVFAFGAMLLHADIGKPEVWKLLTKRNYENISYPKFFFNFHPSEQIQFGISYSKNGNGNAELINFYSTQTFFVDSEKKLSMIVSESVGKLNWSNKLELKTWGVGITASYKLKQFEGYLGTGYTQSIAHLDSEKTAIEKSVVDLNKWHSGIRYFDPFKNVMSFEVGSYEQRPYWGVSYAILN